uniref:RRM domain-containing protein n=1 Tax=Kalanchoe fedtschenkoi TaxID=63787 RepID=A0A7N0T4B8_KALFE
MEQPSHTHSMGSAKVPFGGDNREMGVGAWKIFSGTGGFHASSDTSLFSCSLPVLPHEKLNVNGVDQAAQSIDDLSSNLNKTTPEVDSDDSVNGIGSQAVGALLPDDVDALFSGLPDDLDLSNLPSQLDDLEDDFFGSGGGMEIESHDNSLSMSVARMSIADGLIGNGVASYPIPNGVGAVAGEHPFGEHPSRTLFVRNINSNVEDSELRALFEQYGDIRALYTACKHRGFVMISYYDIRAARTAMRALQNKPLRRRKLDIHFSIPKDNPSDKDMNQGTLVAFNLDPSVSNDDLLLIFGEYGEVKEIRETPHKRHHKFIEFYDVRAAEAALKALNRSDIAGKRIKLEPSRPGGARRNLMLHMNQDLDQDETPTFRHHVGSPITNSPPGNWLQFNSPIESSPMHGFTGSPKFGIGSPAISNSLPGPVSLLHHQASNSLKIAPIGKDQRRGGGIVDHMFGSPTLNQTNIHHSHSFPDPDLNQHIGTSSFGTSTSNGSGIGTLSGPQFLWGSPNPRPDISMSPAMQKLSIGNQFVSNERGLGNGYPNPAHAASYLSPSLSRHHHLHQVGSAPSGVPLERHFGFPKESPETSFIPPAYGGGLGMGNADRSYLMNMGMRGALNSSLSYSGYLPESGSPSLRMMAPPRVNHLFNDGSYPGLNFNGIDNLVERGRNRRTESNGNQIDSKKQFQLDLEKIISGEDTRTTLMIKNIPNKYTSKMLLAAIDETNKGTYDFLYLPIDFKNKCNVGYAFINMLSPKHIIPFYQAFDGKKWEKFNSEKVASLAYARIQGKSALVTHFQNSSLMNEDKRCRPIVFNSGGPEGGDQISQEHFPSMSPKGPILSDQRGSASGGVSSGFSTDRS